MTKYIFVLKYMFLLLLPLTMGCASMMHGSTESVGISSNPDMATVFVNGEKKGETPTTLDLKRKYDYTIVLKKEGYQDASSSITHNVSGWVWGNVLLGGLIGLAVDASKGGMYKLSTDTIHVDLIPKGGDLPAHLSPGKEPVGAEPKPGPPEVRKAPGIM